MSRTQRILARVVAPCLPLLLVACGDGDSSGPDNPPPVVTLSASSATVSVGGTASFAATVTHDAANQGVVWELQGSGCNGGPCGRLQDSSTDSVVYLAPDQVPNPATETVTATAVADRGASASATIEVVVGIQVVGVSPASMTVALGDARQFSADVNLSSNTVDASVAWSIEGCPVGADCGSFSPSITGVGEVTSYTAPASAAQDLQITVKATSVADARQFATAAVTISTTGKPISVAVSAAALTVAIGDSVSITATVSNGSTGAGVSFSISCTAEPCGGMDADMYVAPNSPETAQVGNLVTITATSNEDPTKSGSTVLTLTSAAVDFTKQFLPVGQRPDGVALADFNGDGSLDMAVADYGDHTVAADGDVSILLGDGTGSFQPATSYPAGKNPLRLAVGEFNGDGKPDLVLTDYGERPNNGDGNVSLLIGNSDGSFQSPAAFAAGAAPLNLAVGDFNNDLLADVAVTDYEHGSSTAPGIRLLLGNGDGAFQAIDPLSGVHYHPLGVAAADLNADGNLDMAVIGQFEVSSSTFGNGIGVLLGHGDGNFELASLVDLDTGPSGISIADLNEDTKPDLVVTSHSGFDSVRFRGEINVAIGNDNGTFAAPRAIKTSRSVERSPVVSDFDGDGHLDVAEISGGLISGGVVNVYRGDGQGGVRGHLLFSAGDGLIALASADLDKDGRPDLIAVNNRSGDITVFVNVGSGP